MSRRKGRAGTTSIEGSTSQYVDVDFDIPIDELSDEELKGCIDEAKKRGLLIGGGATGTRRDRLLPIYEALVARRINPETIAAEFEQALFDENDIGLFRCWHALREGNWSEAICALDSEIYDNIPGKAKAEFLKQTENKKTPDGAPT